MDTEKVRGWFEARRAQLVGTLPVIVFFIALFWIVQLGFGDQYLLAVSPFTTLFETRLKKYNPPSQYARFFLVSALALAGARLAVTNLALCVVVNLAMPFALVFMRSSQLNPRRYFPYTMLFAFLQLRPANLVSNLATQAAVLVACCATLSVGLLLAGALRHRAREARTRLHECVLRLADALDRAAERGVDEALRSELLLVFCGGIAIIVLVSHLLMKHLVGRLQASDERRVAVFAQMEHNQKLSSIGRLAAGVAHEVNNPLAVINEKAGLGLDLLHMSGNFERKDRLISLLEAIESTVERARGITHRLLGFARRMEANRQELSVPEVLTETMGFLERGAKNRGVTIGTDFAEGLPDIVSDRGQLQQVFLNIMGNALDAVPDGGKVDIACSRMADGGLLVRVTDNGKGMSPEVIKHIFEPFYSTKKEKGNGLGMFITYGIVRRLGGEITVDSTEGKGTTVSITLPLTPPERPVEA